MPCCISTVKIALYNILSLFKWLGQKKLTSLVLFDIVFKFATKELNCGVITIYKRLS